MNLRCILISGSHAGSLESLRNGTADMAAIDAHSWPLLDSRGITIIGKSKEAPTPPFVMHRRSPITPALMHEALSGAIQQAGASINIETVMSASPCCALS